MTSLRRYASALALTVVVLQTHEVLADGKPTIKDRIDRVVATLLMADPEANVDYDMKHVLDEWRAMKPRPLEELSPEDARRQPSPVEAAARLLAKEGKSANAAPVDVRSVTIRSQPSDLQAKIFTDASSAKDDRRLKPVVVFFHGGGFVLENDAGTDASSRAIASLADAIVLAPAYRLAPENKFPAAADDALAAYAWTIKNAASFGGDPSRVALAGEGAGGMLAADAAMAARDARMARPAALVLITPAAGIDLRTNSWLEDSTARPWNKKAVEWALRHYLPSPSARNDPRVDLVGKADVDGLPATTIVTAEDDPLRSDGERLGGKLRRATVPVDMRDYPGVTHDFFGMGAAVGKAAEAERFVGDNLRKAFQPPQGQASTCEQMGVEPVYKPLASGESTLVQTEDCSAALTSKLK
jgi:acetyl esterase